MDYEKEYKEALERAKVAQETCINLGNISGKSVIERIFPELKESEDERIRKELLNAFQESEDSLYMVLTPQRRKSFIAWLEKQGEQKSAWSEEDEENRINAIKYLELFDAQGIHGDVAVPCINWLKSFKDSITSPKKR